MRGREENVTNKSIPAVYPKCYFVQMVDAGSSCGFLWVLPELFQPNYVGFQGLVCGRILRTHTS